jgi:DHA2 family lincomycin resistance protein-like MFS transporter
MFSPKKKTGTVIAVAALAAFLATFNETFLNIAFSPIMNDLGIPVSTVQWLATTYMLGAAVMIPVSAFAYRSIRTKQLFLFSAGLLIAGSVTGALAPDFRILLAGRIVQALGTGLLIPVGMNITLECAPREKLGIYMGIMGAMTTLGPSLSIIMAGAILSFFSWHALLWTFAAMSVLLFLFGLFALGDIAKLTHPKLDISSVILIGLALVGILYGISTAFEGNILFAAGSALAGAVFLCVFILRQKNLGEPLINLKPLSSKTFSTGIGINMIALIVIFAMNIILPIFLQSAAGASSLAASLSLFPAIILSCAVAPLAGKIYDRHGAKKLLPAGFAMIFIFLIALAAVKNCGSLIAVALCFIPVICGSALIIGPVQSLSLSKLRPELNPHGITVLSTGFQIAGCIGSSLFAGIYFAMISSGRIKGLSFVDASLPAFTAAALLAAGFALAGFFLSIRMNGLEEKKKSQAKETVRSIMKTDVFTASGNTTILEALKLITAKKVSGVPVLDASGNISGFISDGDILRHLAKHHPLFINAYSLAAISGRGEGFDMKLRDLMTRKVSDVANGKIITVHADDDIGEVCRILTERKLKKAPVMENGRMIGIINRSNITKYAMKICLKKDNSRR